MAPKPRRPRVMTTARSKSRSYIKAKRKIRRKSVRRRMGTSPLVPKLPRKGDGAICRARAKRKGRTLERKLKAGPPTRDLVMPGSPWKYVVHFHTQKGNWRNAIVDHKAAEEYIRHNLHGTWKIVREHKAWYSKTAGYRLIDRLMLTDESDLFMLMLCHRDVVRKIFRVVAEEAPQGL